MAKTPTDIKSLARSYTPMTIQVLAGIAQNGQQESARVAACKELLDRGWGKAEQKLEAEHIHRYIARVPEKAASAEAWQQQHPSLQ